MTCFSAANYICDVNGHSKELGARELGFTEDALYVNLWLNVIFLGKMPPDVLILDHNAELSNWTGH